jgi:hypothetical protein
MFPAHGFYFHNKYDLKNYGSYSQVVESALGVSHIIDKLLMFKYLAAKSDSSRDLKGGN